MRSRMMSKGTVVDKFTVTVGGARHELLLRVSKGHVHGTTEFIYAVSNEDPKFRVEHADPKECMKLAREQLDELLRVEWTKMLMVTTRADREEGRIGEPRCRGISIEYKAIETATQFGKPLWREKAKWRDDGYDTNKGLPSDNGFSGEVTAVIPDTPANRVALESLVVGIETLTKRVQQLLNPEQIQRTLADVKVLALPAPATEIRLKGKRLKLRKRS